MGLLSLLGSAGRGLLGGAHYLEDGVGDQLGLLLGQQGPPPVAGPPLVAPGPLGLPDASLGGPAPPAAPAAPAAPMPTLAPPVRDPHRGLVGDVLDNVFLGGAIQRHRNNEWGREVGNYRTQKAVADRQAIESTITDPNELALYRANPEQWAKARGSTLEMRGAQGGDSIFDPRLNGGRGGFVTAPKLVSDDGIYGTQLPGSYVQTGARGPSIAETHTALQDDPNTVGGPAWDRVQNDSRGRQGLIYEGQRVGLESRRVALEGQRLSAETADVGLTPDTINLLAEQVAAGGALPALGMGKSATQARQAILNQVGVIRKAGGVDGYRAAEVQATYKANSAALSQVSRQRNAIESFENTAIKNADLALGLAPKGGGSTGVPVLNRYIQAGRKNIGGDPDVAAFDAALGTFADEYAKVVSGNTGAAGATDGVRAEVRSRINGAMSPAQLKSVIDTMKAEMRNRSHSLKDQEVQLRGALSNNPAAPPAAPQGPPSVAAPAPQQRKPGAVYQTPRGALQWTGTGWVKP